MKTKIFAESGRRSMRHGSYSSEPRAPTVDTTASLRSTIRKLELELRRENRRYRKLDGNCHKLRREHEQMQAEATQLKADNETLASQIHEAEDIKFYIVDQFIRPYARKRGMRVRDDSFETFDRILKPMLHDALEANILHTTVNDLQSKVDSLRNRIRNDGNQTRALQAELATMEVSHTEAQSLKAQVQVLQKQLLARVEKVRIVSDDQLETEFRNLVALVKSLSRSVRFAKDMKLLDILDICGLLKGVQDDHWSTRARKKLLIEAWIWSVLIEKSFKTPFATLGSNDAAMATVWTGLFDNKHFQGWPAPSALCENWRYKTVEHAVETLDLIDEAANMAQECERSGIAPSQESRGVGLHARSARANEAANEIGARLAILSSATDFQILPRVTEAASALALQMALQRSRLQLTFPNVDDPFDGTRMSAMPDPDDEDCEDGVVSFIVRPALTKWGNAYGEHFDQRYDIVPALVKLQAHQKDTVVKVESM